MTITNIASSTNSVPSKSSSSSSGTDSLASEQTFLQLFTAQLKYQDPLNPNSQDGTQMVSELAQFSELEQVINIGSDVHTIASDASSAMASGAAQPGTTSTSGQDTTTSAAS